MPDRQTEEKKRHSTALVPYSYYECRIPYDFMNVPMHWHSEFEINLISQGKGEFICGDDRFTAIEGDLVILPPNMLHAAYPCQENELIYHAFVFHPSMLGAGTNDRCTTECIRPLMSGEMKIRPVISSDHADYPQLKRAVEQILSCIHGNLPQSDLLLKSELMRLFWLLETDAKIFCRNDNKVSYSEAVRPALEYIAVHFRENITVAQLADVSHMSKSYFMSCFKKAVGSTAIEYLAQLRINAACEALVSTKKNISEIAFNCGYSNLSNFNRQFKKITGCLPKKYRSI